MSAQVALWLKDLARGARAARSLTREDAEALGDLLFAGALPDAQVGALLVALRMKGESADEISGLAAAMQRVTVPLACRPGTGMPVVIPSYNGARRTPNLLPLLALLLRGLGVPVLLHGPLDVPGRVGTASILAALGERLARDTREAEDHLVRHGLAFVSPDVLCPPLAALLAWRTLLGVRNVGHSLVKLLAPLATPSLTLLAVTHPAYLHLLRDYCQSMHRDALLFRGHEGEAVAAPGRLPDLEWHAGGAHRALPGLFAGAPDLPSLDAAATAAFIRDARRNPAHLPATLLRQVALVLLATYRAADETDATAQVRAFVNQPGGW